MSAIVLLSGGLDSAVCLKQAYDAGGVALAITFDYGQRAAAREVAAAAAMCRVLEIEHRVVGLPWLGEISGSALVDPDRDIPEVGYDQLGDSEVTSGHTAGSVWVGNRNGLFVNIGAAFAEERNAPFVVAGFNREESLGFPDNSKEFVAACNVALRYSTRTCVKLVSFTQDLSKAEIVQLGRTIGAPLLSIWSCYFGGQEHCGRCESCARLERALRGTDAWEWFRTGRMAP